MNAKPNPENPAQRYVKIYYRTDAGIANSLATLDQLRRFYSIDVDEVIKHGYHIGDAYDVFGVRSYVVDLVDSEGVASNKTVNTLEKVFAASNGKTVVGFRVRVFGESKPVELPVEEAAPPFTFLRDTFAAAETKVADLRAALRQAEAELATAKAARDASYERPLSTL